MRIHFIARGRKKEAQKDPVLNSWSITRVMCRCVFVFITHGLDQNRQWRRISIFCPGIEKPAPLLSFNTASLRQSELVHGVRTETEHYNYNIKMKKMLVM